MRSVLQSSLLEHTVQRAFGHVNAGMTGDGNQAGFGPVLEMAVASPRSHEKPAVVFHKSDDITDFHSPFLG
jgi:hypothetical protein